LCGLIGVSVRDVWVPLRRLVIAKIADL